MIKYRSAFTFMPSAEPGKKKGVLPFITVSMSLAFRPAPP